MTNNSYMIHTAARYSISKDEGASAYVIIKNGITAYKGVFKVLEETSQRAELKAVIGAVIELPKKAVATVLTHSKYAIASLGDPSWEGESNNDLIDMFRELISTHSLDIKFEWVRAGSNEHNMKAREMCGDCLGYEPTFNSNYN